jgi:anaerobic selenocysteine-containing dehydrogenase
MKVSRRIMLKSGAVIAGVAAFPWLARPAAAQAKATKQAMQYQDQPKNGQRCDTCMQFIPGAKADGPGTCKVVEGPISPSGYCIAYVKKS